METPKNSAGTTPVMDRVKAYVEKVKADGWEAHRFENAEAPAKLWQQSLQNRKGQSLRLRQSRLLCPPAPSLYLPSAIPHLSLFPLP